MGQTRTQLIAANDYVVFDTETTGLDATWCEIIEIAALKVEGGIVVDRFETLIRPDELPLPAFITDLTGITTEMVLNAPTISAVLPQFLDFISDSVLVGHNVTFDERFVSSAAGSQILNTLVDTMRISRHVNKALASHRLNNVVSECFADREAPVAGRSHRAMHDVECTYHIYEQMKPRLVALYGENPEAGYRRLRNSGKHSSKTKSGEIVQTAEEIDESNPFYGMRVCFTGKMSSMPRAEAWQRLVNLGGVIEENAVKNLDYLVIGNEGFVSGVKGDKSSKIIKAEKNQLKGFPVQIISEDFFLEFARDV